MLRSIRDAFLYQKASKLANKGEYKTAIEVLSKFEGTNEYSAKKVLFQADIYHRMHSFEQAEMHYIQFCESEIRKIKPKADMDYLRVYCDYYLLLARQKMGSHRQISTTAEDVFVASKAASYLVKAEFPPP